MCFVALVLETLLRFLGSTTLLWRTSVKFGFLCGLHRNMLMWLQLSDGVRCLAQFPTVALQTVKHRSLFLVGRSLPALMNFWLASPCGRMWQMRV
jgi:hypothetical protein